MLVVKNLPANAVDIRKAGLIPGSRRSPGGGHGNRLQCSCLESPMNRGTWWATVHGVTKSQTELKRLSIAWNSQVVLMVKNLPDNVGDMRDVCSIPGLARYPGERHGNPLQCSCLEISMDRGPRWATVHGVTKSWTRLSSWTQHTAVKLNPLYE